MIKTLLSIKELLLNLQQFGALPKRSAVNLTAYIMHNVERAFAEYMWRAVPTDVNQGSVYVGSDAMEFRSGTKGLSRLVIAKVALTKRL